MQGTGEDTGNVEPVGVGLGAGGGNAHETVFMPVSGTLRKPL